MNLMIRLFTVMILAAFLAGCAAPSEPAPTLPSATPGPLSQPTAAPVSLAATTPTPAATLAPDVSTGTGPGDPAPTAAATATSAPNAGQLDTPTITLNDNGTTLKLKTGQRFLLQLGETYDWQLIIADQSVVSRVKNVMVIRGAQGLFDALNPGQSEVSAMGDPVCRGQKPACAQPSVLFRLTVIVE